jgi:hypothetical protein
LLRLSAMISQYFFTAAFCPMRRAVRLWLVFPVPADARDMSESHDLHRRTPGRTLWDGTTVRLFFLVRSKALCRPWHLSLASGHGL